jgi:hypothetical protein
MTDESEFEKLSSDVNWQWKSLHDYIKTGFIDPGRARVNMLPSELVVQNVLEAYLSLMERFYGQFRDQLQKAYEQKSVSDADVAVLLQQALNKLTAEWERVYSFIAATEAKKTSETQKIITQLSPLIRAAIRDVGFSPDSFPVIPQFGTVYSLGFFNYTDDFMALNLPITALQSPWEWTIFWHEIAGQKVRLLKKTRVEFQAVLAELFSEMRRKVMLEIRQYPNQEDFENVFKSDTKDYLFMLLSWIVPFPQLNSLTSNQLSDFLNALTDAVYQDWESPDSSNSSLINTRKLLQDLSPERSTLPILMFSFEDLLDEVTEDLRIQQKKSVKDNLLGAHKEALTINRMRNETRKNEVMDELYNAWEKALSLEENLAAQKKALAEEGWSADWLEELFEDSFSAMNFDVNFLPIFDRLLRRHADGGKDLRHPPHDIRLAAASALKLLDCDETLLKEDLPPKADQLPTGLSDEERTILQKFYPGSLSASSLMVVWLAAKKFHLMHQRMKMPQDGFHEVIQKAKEAIANAMQKHTGNLNTSEEIAQLANRVLASLAEMGYSLTDTSQTVISGSENKNESPSFTYADKIDILLNTRNIIPPRFPLGYRELLDLSFYDVDFLGTTITNVVVNNQSKNWTIRWMRVLSDGIKRSDIGPISYSVDGIPHKTTLANWNVDFGNSEYRL